MPRLPSHLPFVGSLIISSTFTEEGHGLFIPALLLARP